MRNRATIHQNRKRQSEPDKESDVFEIKRRKKQEDPKSSLLFNTVLQVALTDDLARWQKECMGICLGDSESDCLTNLRYADDVLLFSTSLEQLQKMMCDFKKSRGRVGLKKPPGEDETSQQPKFEQRIDDQEHQSRDFYQEKNVPGILDKQQRSSNRRQQRSGVEYGPPGRRSTGSNRS